MAIRSFQVSSSWRSVSGRQTSDTDKRQQPEPTQGQARQSPRRSVPFSITEIIRPCRGRFEKEL